ncbi:MAG TPA: hypothetical protein VFC03_20865, partial [Acidimicrobiales bacterium]|nr:hypothetical protein [Acidimicrobiales bacterium]
MALRRLETIVGEPEQANTSDERAQNILDSLRYGHNLGFECGLPRVSATHWARLQVLEETPQDEPTPFERLAS